MKGNMASRFGCRDFELLSERCSEFGSLVSVSVLVQSSTRLLLAFRLFVLFERPVSVRHTERRHFFPSLYRLYTYGASSFEPSSGGKLTLRVIRLSDLSLMVSTLGSSRLGGSAQGLGLCFECV